MTEKKKKWINFGFYQFVKMHLLDSAFEFTSSSLGHKTEMTIEATESSSSSSYFLIKQDVQWP